MTQEKNEPGGCDPLSSFQNSKLLKYESTINRSNFGVLCDWLCRNVFGHSKNLLDFKRPITRCGPLSIF